MNKFVAAALIASASFAANAAGLAYSEGADGVSTNAAVSTLSRAEVQNQVVRTVSKQLAYDADSVATPVAHSTLNRADVQAQAALAGLHLQARHALPANNLLLVWGFTDPARRTRG